MIAGGIATTGFHLEGGNDFTLKAEAEGLDWHIKDTWHLRNVNENLEMLENARTTLV